MKKLILILLCAAIFLMAAVKKPVEKSVDYRIPNGRATYVELSSAKYIGDYRVVVFGDVFNSDSLILQGNAYWLDNKAPFILTTNELDSLLAWR